jgi:hypothetical protein
MSPSTLVSIYQTARRHTLEDSARNIHSNENTKSDTILKKKPVILEILFKTKIFNSTL